MKLLSSPSSMRWGYPFRTMSLWTSRRLVWLCSFRENVSVRSHSQITFTHSWSQCTVERVGVDEAERKSAFDEETSSFTILEFKNGQIHSVCDSVTIHPLGSSPFALSICFRQISGSDDMEQERKMTALLRQFALKRSVSNEVTVLDSVHRIICCCDQ